MTSSARAASTPTCWGANDHGRRAVVRRARQRLDHHQRRGRAHGGQAHRHARDAPDPDRTSSFLNIRVADIQAVYEEWSARGAEFLTPPQDRGGEIRCYIRDPDGHLIEVGQTSPAFPEQID